MSRSHLTLAALVSSALDGFRPASSRDYSAEVHDDVDAAVIEDASGTALVVEVPRTGAADLELRAEANALDAMSAGIRARLPFAIPAKVGQAPVGNAVALISTFVPGVPVTATVLAQRPHLARSIGHAIASVHELPSVVLTDAGSPSLSALDARVALRDTVARARATNMLPSVLGDRWESAVDNDSVWQFEPTVVHSTLTADAIRHDGDSVSGIVGWHALRVGDPAKDLSWLVTLDNGPRAEVLASYSEARGARVDPHLVARATLYSEVDVARWLLHGIDKKSSAIVDDAVEMLGHVMSTVTATANSLSFSSDSPVLDASQVQQLLDETSVSRDIEPERS